MAEVSVKSSFETLVAVSKMNDSKRQVILRGSCPLLTNPYISYSDRVLLDFRIGLTDEEKDMSLAELKQKFSKLHKSIQRKNLFAVLLSCVQHGWGHQSLPKAQGEVLRWEVTPKPPNPWITLVVQGFYFFSFAFYVNMYYNIYIEASCL